MPHRRQRFANAQNDLIVVAHGLAAASAARRSAHDVCHSGCTTIMPATAVNAKTIGKNRIFFGRDPIFVTIATIALKIRQCFQ
jgi:hypothetical protein